MAPTATPAPIPAPDAVPSEPVGVADVGVTVTGCAGDSVSAVVGAVEGIAAADGVSDDENEEVTGIVEVTEADALTLPVTENVPGLEPDAAIEGVTVLVGVSETVRVLETVMVMESVGETLRLPGASTSAVPPLPS